MRVKVEGVVVAVEDVLGRDGRVGFVVALVQREGETVDVARLWLPNRPGVAVGQRAVFSAFVPTDGRSPLRSVRLVEVEEGDG
jgi:hypothetical protein